MPRPRVGAVALVMSLMVPTAASGSDDGAAPHGNECASLPRPRMRIRLSLVADLPSDAAVTIRETAAHVWSREGLAFDWDTEPISRHTWQRTNIWIVAQHAAVTRTNHAALGAVTFVGNEPQPLVRLSLDAAMAWVRRDLAQRLKSRLPSTLDLSVGDSRWLVLRAIGYAAAHEIGHYVLATKHHADSGLMRAIYDEPETLRQTEPLSLDANSRDQLRARLTLAALCR